MSGVPYRLFSMYVKFFRIFYAICILITSYKANAQLSFPLPPPDSGSICIFHETKYTCDCDAHSDKIVELPQLDGNVFHISVANCNDLIIPTDFLAKTINLRSITFTNIRNIAFRERALAFTQMSSSTRLIIEFNNTTVKEVQAHVFLGNIDEIIFTSCQIDLIRAFAFTSFRGETYLVKFIDTIFNIVEPQAFKKFSVNQLEITNCNFLSMLSSRTFYEIDVVDFLKIFNTTFNGAYARAFSFSSVSMFTFEKNQFFKVDGQTFEMKIRDSVTMRSNNFTGIHPGAFQGIDVLPETLQRSEKIEYRFLDNTIHQQNGPLPLYFNEHFQIVIRKLYYTAVFDCNEISLLSDKFFRTYEDFIVIRLREVGEWRTVHQIVNIDCINSTYWVYVGTSLGILLLLAIVIAGVGIYVIRIRKKRKLDVVMPEPRTYRETQIVLQIENAGLLKTDM